MVGVDVKSVTMRLMEKRDAMEIEMNSIIDRLSQPGAPGITGNLLDQEGFPRSDLDVPAVRADRRRLSELRNDHKDITSKINQNIIILHSARLAPKNPAVEGHAVNTSTSSGVPDEMVDVTVAFAVVDEIAEGSPSAQDGLQLGDQIVKFGAVESSCQDRLALEAQSNQGRPLALVVLRHGVVTNLALTPRPWHGRGLLGCHFRML